MRQHRLAELATPAAAALSGSHLEIGESETRRLRIALVNVWPDSNKGACALTWASLDLVLAAFPDASIAIVPTAVSPPDPAPFRHTAPRYPGVTILPALFDGKGRPAIAQLWRLGRKLLEIFRFDRDRRHENPTLEFLRTCDLVVSVGGVNFDSVTGSLRDDPRLVIRVLPLIAAQKVGTPVVLVGAQIGPLKTRLSRWLVRRIAAKSAAVFPRDHRSAAELRGLESTLLPDSALALTFSKIAHPAFDAAAPTLALVISSALRAMEGRSTHVALLARIATSLVESGFVRQIIVVLQADEDREISRALVQKLELEPRFFISGDLDPEQLSILYGGCRMVISSRLHAVLLSLLAGVPAVSLAPEVTFKERSVLEIVGLDTLWVPSMAGADRALEKCLEVASHERDYRKAIEVQVAAARAQWHEVPGRLRELVQTVIRSRPCRPAPPSRSA
jgi:polysaccharide pyruvyl transferase WcaK-like protein